LLHDEGRQNAGSGADDRRLVLRQRLGGRAQPIGEDFAGSSLQVKAGADHVDGLSAALRALEASPAARQQPESVKQDERH